MKSAFAALLLCMLSLRGEAQISSYGEFALSLGTGRYLEYSTPGFHLGGTAHCVAGLQYGVLALNAGLGFVMLSDEATEPYFLSTRTGRHADIDFPVGMALRFPLNNLIVAVGADLSGFIGSFNTLTIAPHVDLLFAGKRVYRGIFLKGFINLDRKDPAYRPQYFGIGFKTTFG